MNPKTIEAFDELAAHLDAEWIVVNWNCRKDGEEMVDGVYQYKLIPLNRKTGKPAFEFDQVKPQIEIDIVEFERVMNTVNPVSNAGLLPALVLTPEKDREGLIASLAEAISEMFGSDVYYRPKDDDAVDWIKQDSLWSPRR